jgi:hypothetical protein
MGGISESAENVANIHDTQMIGNILLELQPQPHFNWFSMKRAVLDISL